MGRQHADKVHLASRGASCHSSTHPRIHPFTLQYHRPAISIQWRWLGLGQVWARREDGKPTLSQVWRPGQGSFPLSRR